jgi:hypothetical protein
MTFEEAKAAFAIAVAILSMIGVVSTVLGFWFSLRYQLNNVIVNQADMKKMLMNGGSGFLQRLEKTEQNFAALVAACGEKHKAIEANQAAWKTGTMGATGANGIQGLQGIQGIAGPPARRHKRKAAV